MNKTLKLLVVDDSKATRTYIKDCLKESLDCEIIEAPSGFDAMKLLLREQIDCIVADIHMPDINGIELIKFIRRPGRNERLPIIIVSSQISEEFQERIVKMGASLFIAKPFDPEILIDAIKKITPSDSPVLEGEL